MEHVEDGAHGRTGRAGQAGRAGRRSAPLAFAARLSAAAFLAAAGAAAFAAPAGNPDGLERAAFDLAAGLGALADFSTPFAGAAPAKPGAPDLSGSGRLGPAALAALAEERNPGLVAARAALAGSEADLSMARARRLPKVDATLSLTGIANPMDAITFKAGELGTIPMHLLNPMVPDVAIPDKDVTFMPAGDPYYGKAGLVLTQPLFTWGKTKAGVDMARAGKEASNLSYEKARRELLVKLGATSESLAILGRVDETLGLQADIGARLVFISEESRKAGFITQAELIQARIDVKEVDLARASINQRRELLLQELRGLTGRPELSFGDLGLEAPAAGKPRLDAAGLAEAARRGSLDLALVGSLEAAREAGRRLAAGSRNFLPDLALQLDLSYAGSRLPFVQDGWEDKDDWTLNLTLAGKVSLFDGGSGRAGLAKAEAQLGEARAQAETARAAVDAHVRGALLDLDLARVRLEYDLLKLEGHREQITRLRAERDAGAGMEAAWLRALLDALETTADGWSRLAEYRAALWRLEAVLSD
ncbi:MAG: TolC family protein [Spirochaetaceae bacterium]|nr:TolC family protein [Spirochaetaceae bacterium]